MIGNDIVDIKQSRLESNWQRKGFVQKIFTTQEHLLISNAQNPETMIWMLWSMKEAAYKIYNRKTKLRRYIPQQFVCTITSQNQDCILGKVNCEENVYYTKTILTQESINTIAVNSISDFKNVIEIKNKNIIKDKNGVPYLINSSSNTIQDVSISHHGRFEKVVTIHFKS